MRHVCTVHTAWLARLAGYLYKMRKPTVPATSELSIMLTFALWTRSGWSNANNVMKIDIVKPMPPRKHTPRICFHETSLGNCDMPRVIAKRLT